MAFYSWKPYISVAVRGDANARALLALRKSGRTSSPVVVDGRAIARTFWGKAWCDNLERYSDFANRLPRGRSYVRSGSVVDLQIAAGQVTALVSGSDLYEVQVRVASVLPARWTAVCRDCAGEIDSLIELLQGTLSQAVMARLCDAQTGLFPSPREITFTCSCPDWASMCKHVAAVLYGIGARLDTQPGLLFVLRKVDQQDLVATGGQQLALARARPAAAKMLARDDLSALFGIEIAPGEPPVEPAVSGRETPAARPERARPAERPATTRATRPRRRDVPRPKKPAVKTTAWRAALSKRMKEQWEARRRRRS